MSEIIAKNNESLTPKPERPAEGAHWLRNLLHGLPDRLEPGHRMDHPSLRLECDPICVLDFLFRIPRGRAPPCLAN